MTQVVMHCERLLADFKVLRDEPLPRLPSGKLAKTTIRDQYSDIPDIHPKLR